MNLDDRMAFIIEYMSAYKAKIEMSNKNGLFSPAKMFELFALEICKIYFEQDFFDLNTIFKENFPIFDLISADKKIFVQVSTEKSTADKVRNTLKDLENSTEPMFQKIDRICFFMLHDANVDKIDKLIEGIKSKDISYIGKDNLITISDIVEKAKSNMQFQEKLYRLIKREYEGFNEISTKLAEEIAASKAVGLLNIDMLINGEYEIDRSKLISKIISDDAKFISIQGREGSGKSALCKKLVEKEKIILYARAEKFVESKNLEEIWNLDIEKILELLNEKRIVFFVDALEFIADASKIQFSLFERLYSVVQKHKNSYIVTSCRTCDKNAFLRLESIYSIKVYEVNDISDEELLEISNKYPIIKRFTENKSYSELLKTPFYVNLIISKSINIENINDVNELRRYIWEYIICLKEKCRDYKVSYDRIVNQVNKIVFDRATNFLVGASISNVDSSILQVLETEGIVVQNSYGVRLKYDIYEDICFELYFDNQFNLCKGEYLKFYQNIESIGRCIYRRYQIWISNKLFINENRDRFLYKLIFSTKTSDKWKKQTEIGIVKSDYCENFFESYDKEIINANLLEEFIDVINLYAYESKIIDANSNRPILQLKPAGYGRASLIKIIYQNFIYKLKDIDSKKIVKLCLDIASQKNNCSDEIANYACNILQYYVDLKINANDEYKIIDDIDNCLAGIYLLAKYSVKWIKNLFKELSNFLLNGSRRQKAIARDIIDWTLKNPYICMLNECLNEFCDLLNDYWLGKCENAKENYIYEYEEDYNSKYGLNRNINNYHFKFEKVEYNLFLRNLYYVNTLTGLNWTINFINKAVENYYTKYPNELIKVKIDLNGDIKEYYGNFDMWMICSIDNCVPLIISDMIYYLNKFIIEAFKAHKNSKSDLELYANYLEIIKNIIYSKSNNVILLKVIENIGFTYEYDLPGYAIDLIRSIEIINWDINRYVFLTKNQELKRLEEHVLLTVGLPKLEKRYISNENSNIDIQSYARDLQIYFDDKIKNKTYQILDYLYSKYDNNKKDSIYYLQIQKMDLREAKKTKIDKNTIVLEPKITGEAKKIVENQEKSQEKEKKLCDIVSALNLNEEICTNDLISIIDELQKICLDEDKKSMFENFLIASISVVLTRRDLPEENRNAFCLVWVEGIKKILNNYSFNSEIKFFPILLGQLSENINENARNEIKNVMLKILMNERNNGIVSKYSAYTKQYLYQNKTIAKIIFNTIVELAHDEMQHQKYNAKYIKKMTAKNNRKFVPNMQPKLIGVDKYIKDTKNPKYDSQVKQIIDKYLYCEEELNIKNFKMTDYDISTLCYISNCGLGYEDDNFVKIMKDMLHCIIRINNECDDSHMIINSFDRGDFIEYFYREIIKNNDNWKSNVDLLFDNIDFSSFSKENIEMYEYIFSGFICEFYDAYIDKNRRSMCKEKIAYIESKVNNISEVYVKNALSKILFFSVNRYTRWNIEECKTSYNYMDKMFLNNQLKKYGKYHIKDAFYTIYQLNINELMPEILLSVDEIISNNEYDNSELLRQLKGDCKEIINIIIVKAFINFSDKIKENDELCLAYERLLEKLIELNITDACVILDEFRIH